MRRVIALLLVSVLVCLMSVGVADAKGKKGNRPKAPGPATVEENFSHMNANSEGLVNEDGLAAFKKWQNPAFTKEKARRHAEEMYPKVLAFMKGDKSKGFNLEAYKAFKAAADGPKAEKPDAPKAPETPKDPAKDASK